MSFSVPHNLKEMVVELDINDMFERYDKEFCLSSA